jgi:DNA-binding transcriptional regulator YbjK
MVASTAVSEDRRADRRTEILDAAVRLIGRDGRKAVTHRAVAEEAGVPLGSTTYYFDSREDLLGQALQHVAAEQTARHDALAAELAAIDSVPELARRLIEELVTIVRDRTAYIAEYELWLEAARRPELRESARAWCEAERAALAGGLAAVGSSDPATDARLVAAVLDGLGVQVLTADDPVAETKALEPELLRLIERLAA